MPEPEPGHGIEAELIPAAPSSWRSVHVLVVSNRGARPVEIGVRCSDDAGRLQFEHAPGLRLGPGQTAQLPITTRCAAPWTGPPVHIPFAVNVTTPGGGSLRLTGERTVTALLPAWPGWLPAWIPLVAGLAVAGVAIGTAALLSPGDDGVPADEPPRAALTASPASSTTEPTTTRAPTTTHRTQALPTRRTTTTRPTTSSTTTTTRRPTTTTTEALPFTSMSDQFVPGEFGEVPAKLVDVRCEPRGPYDRLVLEFDGPVANVRGGYVSEIPPAERSTSPSLGGDAILMVTAEGIDDSSTYPEFREVHPGLRAVVDGAITEVYDGGLAFALGVAQRRPFRVRVFEGSLQDETDGSARVVIDVAHPD